MWNHESLINEPKNGVHRVFVMLFAEWRRNPGFWGDLD